MYRALLTCHALPDRTGPGVRHVCKTLIEAAFKLSSSLRRSTPLLIVLGLSTSLASRIQAQSPHGETFKMDCATCHVPDSWTTMRSPSGFDHDSTAFPLLGTHGTVDCKACHTTLLFKTGVSTECVSCHTDVHSMTVGNDCARCHTSRSWLVDEIPELHEQNGFPLVGVHGNLSCIDCHKSENTLAFQRVGNDCINCHRSDFASTQHPDHMASGFSTDCAECHDPFGQGWNTTVVNHDFFPLTLGHDIQDCAQCHTTGNFADASPECVSCHLSDFNATQNPVHTTSGFSTDCASCHTTDPGWSPATFDHDAEFFPIYSGTHNGVWSSCVECHPNPDNFALFTCTNCHTDPATSDEHNGMTGYVYESTACLSCHPNGEAGSSTTTPRPSRSLGRTWASIASSAMRTVLRALRRTVTHAT